MGHTSIVVALLLSVLGGFALVLAWGHRWSPRPRRLALYVLVLCAGVAHTHSLTRDSVAAPVTLTEPSVHLHELVHYYLGSKYYEELGYAPLYEAIVIADYEDERPQFLARNRFRDLRTNRVDRVRGDVIREGSAAKQRFSPERWEEFKADVALLRSGFVSGPAWHRSAIVRDHGYNGSPLTTLLLGRLANQPFVPTVTFLQTVRWLDLLLVGAIAVAVAGRLGASAALGFAVLWLANPFNDYGYVGGSFLRYNFALALLLAWFCLDRGRPAAAGLWLAVAAHLRIFPALFAAGLLLHDLARPGSAERRRALRRHTPRYVSFAVSGAAIAVVTAFTPAPTEQNVWQDFLGRISVHARALASNAIGVDSAFAYSQEQSEVARREAFVEGASVPWEELVSANLEERRTPRILSTLLLLGATWLCARRLPERYALFLGFPLLFSLMYTSHYYFLSLGLLGLLFHDHRAALLILTASFGSLTLLATPTAFDDEVLRFAWSSVATGAALIGLGAVATRPGSRPWADPG